MVFPMTTSMIPPSIEYSTLPMISVGMLKYIDIAPPAAPIKAKTSAALLRPYLIALPALKLPITIPSEPAPVIKVFQRTASLSSHPNFLMMIRAVAVFPTKAHDAKKTPRP